MSASPLAWAARNTSKPGRPKHSDCWVLHATPEWSLEQQHQPPDAFAAALLSAFGEAAGLDIPPPAHLAGHRWRFARTLNPVGAEAIYDPDTRVAVCGDWCPGARVEGAFLSGLDAAAKMLSASAPS